MLLRFHHPDSGDSAPSAPQTGGDERPRLNMLISCGGSHDQSFAQQLPRLLGPMGIRCVQAGCAEETTDVIRTTPIHIAVVDLTIPLRSASDRPVTAGPRVLQLLRRLDQPPPTVVVRPQQWSHRDSGRGLAEALREGAFAVLDRPVPLESMLEVLRRIVRRHYRDHWPAA